MNTVDKDSTKKCECGNTKLLLLRTYNKKVCTVCSTYIPWVLDENQEGVGYRKIKDNG